MNKIYKKLVIFAAIALLSACSNTGAKKPIDKQTDRDANVIERDTTNNITNQVSKVGASAAARSNATTAAAKSLP